MLEASLDFKTLFEQRYPTLSIKEGDLLRGTVVDVRRDVVLVDVGFKSEGLIPIEEFRTLDGGVEVKPGDVVEVVVENMENPNGVMELSKERADAIKSWDRVEQVFEADQPIDGLIANKIKGGMSVNLGGIKAFLPGSQIDLKPVKSLDKLIGQKLQFKILKLNKAKGNIVLSRRVLLEQERESQKRELLKNIREGQVVKGVVKNITDYGAFVDLGGVDGLLHITDVSWARITHPSEVLKVGEEIEVVVLKYDNDNAKVSLGFKQLQSDPWENVNQKFTPGEQIKGKIVNVTDYGVFVELAEGIEGLVHISELTWKKNVKHPSKLVKVGDVVEAVILDVDSPNKRISLGVKQLEVNPWIGLETKYPAGTHVKGVVRNLTDFGAFIGIEGEEIDGLIHISDLSWDRNIKHPSDILKKGDSIEAIVLSVDKENERFALGYKQLSNDPWETFKNEHPAGQLIKGKVIEIQPKGVILELGENITGFLGFHEHVSENEEDAKKALELGKEVETGIKKFDDKLRKVMLSTKSYKKAQEKQDVKEFMKKQGSSKVTLGDAFKQAQ